MVPYWSNSLSKNISKSVLFQSVVYSLDVFHKRLHDIASFKNNVGNPSGVHFELVFCVQNMTFTNTNGLPLRLLT